jgi:hypothetical protein
MCRSDVERLAVYPSWRREQGSFWIGGDRRREEYTAVELNRSTAQPGKYWRRGLADQLDFESRSPRFALEKGLSGRRARSWRVQNPGKGGERRAFQPIEGWDCGAGALAWTVPPLELGSVLLVWIEGS